MCMVIGVGGSEQEVQGIGPPLLGLGDNPLIFSSSFPFHAVTNPHHTLNFPPLNHLVISNYLIQKYW